MSRYKIAIQMKNETVERKAFRFPATHFVARTVQYILHCVEGKAICIADNVPENVLDLAVTKVSNILDLPIVVDTSFKAQLFSISHSLKIYSLNNLPINKYVICYNCTENKLPVGVMAEVMVYGHTRDIKFL